MITPEEREALHQAVKEAGEEHDKDLQQLSDREVAKKLWDNPPLHDCQDNSKEIVIQHDGKITYHTFRCTVCGIKWMEAW